MNGRRIVLPLLMLCAGTAVADGNGVYQRRSEDGTVELTNIPEGSPADYQPVVAPPAPAATPAGSPAARTEPPPEANKPLPISQGPMGDTLRDLYSGAHAAHEAAGR